MSEIIVRITGKMLIARQEKIATDLLLPTLLGFSTPNGIVAVAAVVKNLQTAFGTRDDVAVLQIDFDNALNLVNRHAVRRKVRAHFPVLANYVEACYRERPSSQDAPADGEDPDRLCIPKLLVVNRDSQDSMACEEILSRQGVRQGMRESPLLFASVLHDVKHEFDLEPENDDDQPNSNKFAYLDDVHVFGTHAVLRHSNNCFQSLAAQRAGLHLSLRGLT